jgi:hypothetical protein
LANRDGPLTHWVVLALVIRAALVRAS